MLQLLYSAAPVGDVIYLGKAVNELKTVHELDDQKQGYQYMHGYSAKNMRILSGLHGRREGADAVEATVFEVAVLGRSL